MVRLKRELAQLKEKADGLRARWQAEKGGMDRLSKIKAEIDARVKVLDAHLKSAMEHQKLQHAQAHHEMEVAEAALGLAAAAAGHEGKAQHQKNAKDGSND